MLCLSSKLIKLLCAEDGGRDMQCSGRTLIVLVEDTAVEGLQGGWDEECARRLTLICCQGCLIKEYT